MAWAIMAADQEPSLRVRAMRFLARREHSRAELKRKLAARATEGDDLESLLDDLARRGWLSDARYAELSIRAKARRYGPLKLTHHLRSRGVDDETIASGFRAAGAEGASHLESVWASHFGAPPAGEKERARHVRFLQGRGFALDDVLRFLRRLEP